MHKEVKKFLSKVGKKGGEKAAESMTKEQRVKRAKNAVNAREEKRGSKKTKVAKALIIALMFSVTMPVFANDDAVAADPVLNSKISIVAQSADDEAQGENDSPEAPKKSSKKSGGYMITIQDKIFALTGVRFERTNDQRMLEIYNTLYQLLVFLNK